MPSPRYKTVWEFNASINSDAEMQAFNEFVAGKDNNLNTRTK